MKWARWAHVPCILFRKLIVTQIDHYNKFELRQEIATILYKDMEQSRLSFTFYFRKMISSFHMIWLHIRTFYLLQVGGKKHFFFCEYSCDLSLEKKLSTLSFEPTLNAVSQFHEVPMMLNGRWVSCQTTTPCL